MRVLIVDDQPDVVELLAMLVEKWGLECKSAANGSDALRIADDFKPEVVFLDIGLLDLSGYDVARTLRARGSTAYIVAVTGWGREQDVEQAFDAGFDQHLTKPANRAKLEAAIESARVERTKSR